MGLFFYTKIGSIISIGDLPTTNIIEPLFLANIYNEGTQFSVVLTANPLVVRCTFYLIFKNLYAKALLFLKHIYLSIDF